MALMSRLNISLIRHFYKISIPITPSVMSYKLQNRRTICTVDVTKNLTLFSNERKIKKTADFKLSDEGSRPLVILLSWLMARKKHMDKYSDFYLEKGFDVLNVHMTPWQLLWPVKGAQIIAGDIIKLLDANRFFTPLLIHGFSVGGYLWSEVLVHIEANKSANQHIADRIIGQIWDSAADLTEIPNGLSYAVFPTNKILQTTLRSYVTYHLKTFDKVATSHYLKGSETFYKNLVRAPALFLVSKNDPIGTENSNMRVRDAWEQIGIQTRFKCWDKSPHVGHYHKYPEEYITEVTQFLESLNFNKPIEEDTPKNVKAKL